MPVRNAQMADPEMTSVLALFRRAANVVARLEDAVVFRGLAKAQRPGRICASGGTRRSAGHLANHGRAGRARALVNDRPSPVDYNSTQAARGPEATPGHCGIEAIGQLEGSGHFGPFAVALGQRLFLVAQTPDPGSLVLPQDRIIPFLGGGPLLRSSTLDEFAGYSGVVVALGGAPFELVVATDMCLQFLQVTHEPAFLFRVSEKIALRIREPDAIVQLYMR